MQDMKRSHTIERYREIIEKVRRYIQDASFSSDIIVGIPGMASREAGDVGNSGPLSRCDSGGQPPD